MNEKNQEQYQFAGFWIRLAAYFIDSFILLVPILLVSLLVGFPLEKISSEEIPWSLTLLFLAIVWGYNVFFLTKYGATIGKKVFRVKVIGSDGDIISLKGAVLRETIGKILSSLFFSLGYIWAAFDSKKQAWHDKIAHSYAILTQPLRGFRRFLAIAIPFALPTIIIVGIGLLTTLAFISPTKQINEAQDFQIKFDIANLQDALERYYADNQRFPYSLDDLVPSYISEMPKHPRTKQNYNYYPSADLLHYTLSDQLSSGENYTVKEETSIPASTTTPTLEPTIKKITLYNNPSVQINHLSFGAVYMVARTKEESIYSDWQENLEKILQELKRFYEREFPGMDIKTYIFPKVIIGDKFPEEYRNTDFLPEIFFKEKTLQEWHSDPSRYKVLLVYIDFIKGANEGGYGPSVEGRYTINPAFWLEDRAIYGKDPYGLIGSAHELGHTLGIPHPWEMPENTQNDPNFGNVSGDVMGYMNSSLTLDQVYFSPFVKKRMGL